MNRRLVSDYLQSKGLAWLWAFALALTLLIFAPSAQSQEYNLVTYPATGLWNGFQNQRNIVECNNFGDFPVELRFILKNNFGTPLHSRVLILNPRSALKLTLNDLAAINNAYGTYSLKLLSANPLAGSYIRCLTAIYRINQPGNLRTVQYGYVLPVTNALRGINSGLFNSLNPEGAPYPTSNWLSIVNVGTNPFNANVALYRQSGTFLRNISVTNLAPGQRIDYPVGHNDPVNNGQVVGLYKVEPQVLSAPYLALITRYGSDGSTSTPFAFPLFADRGGCSINPLFASTFPATSNWAEVANVGTQSRTITIEVFNRFGSVVDTETQLLRPQEQYHYNLNAALGNNTIGSFRVLCQDPTADRLLAQSVFYGHPTLGTSDVAWAYATQRRIGSPAGTTLAFPVDTSFSGSQWLKLAEKKGNTRRLSLTLSTSTGSDLAPLPITIGRRQALDLGLFSRFLPNRTGGAILDQNSQTQVLGEMIRVYSDPVLSIGTIIRVPAYLIPNTLPQVQLSTVVNGFTAPLYLTHAGDESDRLFVLEKTGRIKIIEGNSILPTPFLDIRNKVSTVSEQGLLGLAFHPNFESNRRFFVYYTDLAGDTVVSEYLSSSGDPDIADPNSERIILQVDQPAENHNGGQIDFGPDGYFYIALGDGGSAGDPSGHGQDLGDLLGSILRIDVNGSSPYQVPANNPFLNVPNAEPEIWAYGFRNPWRFSFDRPTKRLFAADVGQNVLEEIDLVQRGGNYGWNIMEGSRCFSPPSNCTRTGLQLPITEYTHDEGIAVIGGYVYRGTVFPSLYGKYIFGDFGSGTIWSLRQSAAGPWVRETLLQTNFLISSFGQDEQGELYVVDYDGKVYHLIDQS